MKVTRVMARYLLNLSTLSVVSVVFVSVPFLYKQNVFVGVYYDATNLQLLTKSILFPSKPLVIWSQEYHISPIRDLKNLLRPLGVRFIDKSLAGKCFVTNTCEGRKSLKIINRHNALNLDYSLIPKFYNAYKDDAEMKSVDAFVCYHPTSMCELFMPFNKSIIVIASTRYELGRFGVDRWTKWNKNIVQIASTPGNVVGGNNMYDVEYMKYFTGVEPQLIPSYCGYVSHKYAPSVLAFLLSSVIRNGMFGKIFYKVFASEYKTHCKSMKCTAKLIPLQKKHRSYKYSELTTYAGIVHIPYQVSVMSIFEQYRMNIPLFFPSFELLTTWQHTYMVMYERTWDGVRGVRPSQSSISAHQSQANIPDPNNERNRDAIRYWIKFADFYRMPHITYYDSVLDLIHKLNNITSAELLQISDRMNEYNTRTRKEILWKWRTILTTIAKISINAPH